MSLRIFYHPYYSSLTLPERHRFPLAKYQALFEHLGSLGYPLAEAAPATPEQIKECTTPTMLKQPSPGSLKERPSAGSVFPGHPC